MHQSSSSTRTTPAGGVAPEDTLAAVQRLMQALQEDDAEVTIRYNESMHTPTHLAAALDVARF